MYTYNSPILKLLEGGAGRDPRVVQLQSTSRCRQRSHSSRPLSSHAPCAHESRWTVFLREHTRSVHRLDNLLEVGAVAKESGAGACQVDNPLEECGVDGGEGELPLLLETGEVREKLTNTRCLLQ